jgi:hypothetical protein
MNDHCDLYPTIEKDGKKVRSKLFLDIFGALTDIKDSKSRRDEAYRIYYSAIDENWIDKVSDYAKFDENGEITLHSLSKLANLNFSKAAIISNLQRNVVGNEHTGYAQALQKARNFNKSSDGEDYIAVIKRDKSNKSKNNYILEVKEKSDSTIAELENEIRKHGMLTTLTDTLEEYGIATDFIENDNYYYGRYSSENPEAALDGLIHAIRVANNSESDNVFVEEAAHFAIASLHNTPNIKRLLSLCNDRAFVEKSGVYSKEDLASMSNFDAYETAGRVLAKYISDSQAGGFRTLLSTVKNFMYRFFGKMNDKSITAKKAEVESIAKDISKEFFNGMGSTKTAMSTNMVLYDSTHTASIKSVVNSLQQYKRKLQNINMGLSKQFIKDIPARILQMDDPGDLENLYGETLERMLNEVVDGLVSGLQSQINEFESKKEEWFPGGVITKECFESNSKQREGFDLICAIITALDSYDIINNYIDRLGNGTSVNGVMLTDIKDKVRSIRTEDIRDMFRPYLMQSVMIEYKDMIGADTFEIIGNFKFNTRSMALANKLTYVDKNGKIRNVSDNPELGGNQTIDISQVFTTVFGSANTLHRHVNRSTKSKDIGLSLTHKYINNMMYKQNEFLIKECSGKMAKIEELAKEAGFKHDFSKILEKNDKGEITRDFISEYKRWKYYEIKQSIIDKIYKECDEYIKANPDEFQLEVDKKIYKFNQLQENEEFKKFMEDSIVEEEIIDDDGNTMVVKHLNPDFSYDGEDNVYRNDEYYKLNDKEIELLRALKEYKQFIDNSCYDGVYTDSMRIPQIEIKSSFVTKRMIEATKDLKDIDWTKVNSKDILRKFLDGDFSSSIGPHESALQDARILADNLDEATAFDKGLFAVGVSKIDKPSTDLITSLKLYSRAASKYATVRYHTDILAFAGELLNSRPNASEGTKQDITELLDKTIYGFEIGKKTPSPVKLIKKITGYLFVAKTLFFNSGSSLVNATSASSMWLGNSACGKYTIPGFLKNLLGNVKYLPVIRKLPGIRNNARHEMNITKYINNLYGTNLLWGDIKTNTYLGKVCKELPLKLYGYGDLINQRAIYMSCLEHTKAKKVVGDEVETAIRLISRGQTFEEGVNLTEMLTNIKDNSKIVQLKDVFWGSGEDIYNSLPSTKYIKEWLAEGKKIEDIDQNKLAEKKEEDKKIIKQYKDSTYIKNGYLKPNKSVVDYIILSGLQKALEDAIDENFQHEKDMDDPSLYRTMSDIENTLKLTYLDYDKVFRENNLEFAHPVDGEYEYYTIKDFKEQVDKVINDMLWNEQEIYKFLGSITSMSTDVQGMYYSGAKCKLLDYMEFSGSAIYLGYALGQYDRNFSSAYNVDTMEFENSMLRSILYTRLRPLQLLTNDSVYDDDVISGDSDSYWRSSTKKERMTSFGAVALTSPLLIMLAPVPGIQKAFFGNKKIKDTLNALGYTDQIINRMLLSSGLLTALAWILMLCCMLDERKLDKSISKHRESDIKGESDKALSEDDLTEFRDIYDLDKSFFDKIRDAWNELSWWAKPAVFYRAMGNVIFDAFNKPDFNDELVIDAINTRFNKSSESAQSIIEFLNKGNETTKVQADGQTQKQTETHFAERLDALSNIFTAAGEAYANGEFETMEDAIRDATRKEATGGRMLEDLYKNYSSEADNADAIKEEKIHKLVDDILDIYESINTDGITRNKISLNTFKTYLYADKGLRSEYTGGKNPNELTDKQLEIAFEKFKKHSFKPNLTEEEINKNTKYNNINKANFNVFGDKPERIIRGVNIPYDKPSTASNLRPNVMWDISDPEQITELGRYLKGDSLKSLEYPEHRRDFNYFICGLASYILSRTKSEVATNALFFLNLEDMKRLSWVPQPLVSFMTSLKSTGDFIKVMANSKNSEVKFKKAISKPFTKALFITTDDMGNLITPDADSLTTEEQKLKYGWGLDNMYCKKVTWENFQDLRN